MRSNIKYKSKLTLLAIAEHRSYASVASSHPGALLKWLADKK